MEFVPSGTRCGIFPEEPPRCEYQVKLQSMELPSPDYLSLLGNLQLTTILKFFQPNVLL